MDKTREILLIFDKDKLVDLLLSLLDRLDEKEKIQFVSKNIDAELALDIIRGGDTSEFLREVKKFCKDCIDGNYYVESDYNDYYEDYDEGDFEDSEWAQKFTKYLNITLLYSRNKNYEVAFKAFEALLSCIHEANSDEEILGTEGPEEHIDVDWNDVFNEYYTCITSCITDKEKMTHRAFEEWLNFGERCKEPILSHLNDLPLIEKVIREKIGQYYDWTMQHLIFELLQSFYERYQKQYSKVEFAKSFLKYNVNFYNDIIEKYFELEKWEESIELIKEALDKVQTKLIRLNLQNIRVECCEKSNNFEESFYAAKDFFYEKSTYEAYKRARYFASKVNNLDDFIDEAEKHMSFKNSDGYPWTLIKVLSYEGKVNKLLDFSKKSSAYEQYYYLKYTCRSLLYRAFYSEKLSCDNLNDFIVGSEENNKNGIVDMLVLDEDISKRSFYIQEAVNILKGMVSFHIDAANRSRYAKAAYYCSIIKAVFNFLDKEKEFDDYYDKIIKENNRRPALKEEMKRKMGRI
ncbi:hypothetical protein [Clostridium tagluense]|uniref:hypothetical protein n=1 Tax=Clostridium tagluense TaxID=360422 RepID=UPI001C0DA440|nr:hypothetical protein [Clostridium tagluense]MBU3126227.1 hypothetical protein [Clostridium tagluense]